MDSKEFKKLFGYLAKNGFESIFGGWFKESAECIVVLDLQKSNYGNYYELNIKVFIQGLFGKLYIKGKDLVKKDTGDIFIRQPNDYKELFDLDNKISDSEREIMLDELFNVFIVPFTSQMLSKNSIRKSYVLVNG